MCLPMQRKFIRSHIQKEPARLLILVVVNNMYLSNLLLNKYESRAFLESYG
jgi:hypothetical protein